MEKQQKIRVLVAEDVEPIRIRCVEMSTVKSQIRGILHKFDKRSIREVLLQIDDPKLLEIMTESRRKMAGHGGE